MSRRLLFCTILLFLLVSCSGGSGDNPTAPPATSPPAETIAPTPDAAACTAIVEQALSAVDESCQGTGRNQVCYGNILLNAEFREGAPVMTFERPGDIADLNVIRTVNLSPMDTITNEWGVALMKLQANLPDSLPGQNVTFLLFGDVELENVTEEGSNVEAFYFRTGVADAPCEAAPDSGLLVQTPEGVAEISLRMNGVDVALGSTAYFQAQPGDDLTVSVVEGKAEVSSQGETRMVTAGNRTDVPMDADLNPAGPPSPPQPYQGVEVSSLPVNNLERPINIVTVALASDFTADADDWTIFNDGTLVEHFPADETSDGYICSTDESTGVDWYFQAPDDWLGDQSGAYGGALAYSLRQSSTENQYDAPDLILEGNGLTLNYDTATNPDVEWTPYEVQLREDAGWIRADTRVPPTQEELQGVLADLTALRIRGEFIVDADTGCLDYVQLGNAVKITTPFERPPTPIPPTNTPGPTATATTAATASPTAPPAETFNISVGERVEDGFPAAGAGNLEAPGAIDVYTLTLDQEQNLYFDAQGTDETITWTLSDANGAAIFEGEPLWTEGVDPGAIVLPAGTYRITVLSTTGDAGTYQFAVLPVEAAQTFNISVGTTVSPDVPQPGVGRIAATGETDVFTFTAEAGQQVYFAAQGEDGAFVWSLTAPDGTTVFEDRRLWDGNDPGIYTLEAGTYTITVTAENDNTGTYRFAVSAVGTGGEYQLEPNTVVFDGALDEGAGVIDAPGESDVFTFVVSETQDFYFSAQGEENRIVWTLTAPDGTNLFENQRLWDGNDPGILTLEPGTYSISVAGERDDTGFYQFAFFAVPEPQMFTVTLDAQVYDTVPQAGAGNIEAPGGQDIYTLTLDQAQNVYFASQGEENRMLWTLTAPDGTNLFEEQRLWAGNDPGALTLQPGTYTITVHGDGDDTGTYQFSLSVIPEAQTFDYAPGLAVSDGVPKDGAGHIESAGAQDVFRFALGEAQDLYFAAQGEDGGRMLWVLTDSSGTVYFENQRLWNGNDPGVISLPAGDYMLTVSGEQGNTGTYQFEITPVSETTETQLDFSKRIALETDGFIDSPGGQQTFDFTVEPGQEIFIEGRSGDMTLQWILTDAQGNTVFDQYRNASSNLGLFTLEAGGEYTLTVIGYQEATGSYAFSIWKVPEPQVFEIEIGRVILEQTIGEGAGNIESPGARDVYVFNAESGEVIFIEGQSGDSTMQWTLTDVQGNMVFDQFRNASSNLGLFMLEAGGEYRLTVAGYDDQTGSYRFRIWHVPEPDVFYLGIGEVASTQTLGEGAGNIESPGVQDIYTFDAEPGQTIFIEGLEGNITLHWNLTDEAGNVLFDQYRSSNSAFDPLVLETGGAYTLTVSANDDQTGMYRFQLWDVPDSDTFEIEIGQRIVNDGNIETPGVQDVFTFTVEAGQTIYIDGQSGDITLIWNLQDESGTPVLQDVYRWASSDVGLVTLEAGGMYTLTISAASEESGEYHFQLWDVPDPNTFEIEIGTLISEPTTGAGAGNIETPGVQDIYTFSAEPGQTVYIDGEEGELTLIWNLTDENGEFVLENVYRWGQSDVDIVMLEAGGAYTLTVSANEEETGTYQFQLWDVPEPDTFEIEIGQDVSEQAMGAGAGNIETPGARDVYTFEARQNTTLNIEGTDGDITLIWALTGPDGAVVFEDAYRYAQSSIDGVTLPAGGTYTLTVSANEDETGPYQFRLASGK